MLRGGVLLAGLLAEGLCPAAEPPPQDPGQEQSGAYVVLIQADQARDAKDFSKAIAFYRDALSRYERLARLFPDWEKDIVQYRLTYCANQMAGIVQKTGKSEEDWLAQRVQGDSALGERSQRQMAAVVEENRYLRKRLQEVQPEEDLSELKKEVERLETENKRLAEQLAQAEKNDQTPLLREMVGLREENKKLLEQDSENRRELESLQAELKEGERQSEEMSAQIGNLKTQNRDSEKQRASLQKKLEEFEPLRDEKAALESQVRILTKEWVALQQAQAAWSNEWTALSGQLSASQETARRLESELKALREQLAESKRDRQTLDGRLADLTREHQNARESLEAATAASEQMMADKEAQRHLLEAAQQEFAALSNRLTEAEAGFQAQVAEANQKLEALQSENEELKRTVQKRAAVTPPEASKKLMAEASLQPVKLNVSPQQDRTPLKPLPLSYEEIDEMMTQGLQLELKDQFAEALELYDRILSERPTYLPALKARARTQLQTGDCAGALASLLEGQRLAPTDAQLQLLLSMAYCQNQQFKEAVDVIRPLVLKDPANINARNVLGAACLGLGRMQEARQELEKVLRMNPNLSDAHYNLAQVYLFSRPADLTQARRHYFRALELGATADREIEQLLSPKAK